MTTMDNDDSDHATRLARLRGDNAYLHKQLGYYRQIEQDRLAQLNRIRRQQNAIVRLATDPAVTEGAIDSAAHIICQLAATTLEVQRVGVWLFSADRCQLVCRQFYTTLPQDSASAPLSMLAAADCPQYFAAIDSGRALSIGDVHADPRTSELRAYMTANRVMSTLDAAIRLSGQVVGIVCHEQVGTPREWDVDEITFAGEVADQMGLALSNHERALVLRAMSESEQRFRDFAETGADWFWETDSQLRFSYFSERFSEIVGVPNTVFLGRTRREISVDKMDDPAKWQAHFCDLEARRPYQNFEYRWQRSDGQWLVLRHSGKPVYTATGQFCGYRGVGRDITEAHRLMQDLAYRATHDDLTGLINRREFERRLHAALHVAQRDGSRHVLGYLDLDQFKLVNDVAGHRAGDELLRQLAGVLCEQLPVQGTLARLGGDEFSLLLEHCTVEEALIQADTLLAVVRDYPFFWEGRLFRVGVSIGLAAVTGDIRDTAQLFSQADIACYTAKEAGRSRVCVYTAEGPQARSHDEMRRVARLHNALAQGRFCLYRQPLHALCLGDDVIHYELLLRMLDEDGSVLSSGAIVPAAERFGLMATIDRWVIRSALECYSQVTAGSPKTMIGINLSAQSLADDGLLAYIRQQFAATGTPCDRVCFEITETAAIGNIVQARRVIEALTGDGCRFALDDFGSGLSSFRYLKHLPVSFLKIDGSFVSSMTENAVDRTLVAAINELGHTLGLQTVAEHVEDEATLHMLRELGVDYAQGYLLGRPEPI